MILVGRIRDDKRPCHESYQLINVKVERCAFGDLGHCHSMSNYAQCPTGVTGALVFEDMAMGQKRVPKKPYW